MAILHVGGYSNNKIILVHNLKWQFIWLNRVGDGSQNSHWTILRRRSFINLLFLVNRVVGLWRLPKSCIEGYFGFKCSFMQRCRSVKLIRIRIIEEAEGSTFRCLIAFIHKLVIHKILQLALLRGWTQVESLFMNESCVSSFTHFIILFWLMPIPLKKRLFILQIYITWNY